jgi:CHAD domain-containing protein
MKVERERKYELPKNGSLPDLGRVRGVAAVSDPDGDAPDTLDAVYLDSADLRLARAGVTLRRREGGPDVGWHLKVPVGADAKAEIHERLTEGMDPPAPLVGLVAGILRGAEVGPVARIATTRRRRHLLGRGGDVLAEVTDDRVRGQRAGDHPATRWREIEVELADNTDDRMLDEVEAVLARSGLRRSGSSSKLRKVLDVDAAKPAPVTRRSTAGAVVLSYLREQVTAVNYQDILVRRGAPDAVHQLRVASRRIRSVLRVYGKVLDRTRTKAIQDDLRWLGAKLARSRDLEVLEKRFREAVAALPDELVIGNVNTRLTRYFTPARAAADRAAVRTLNSSRYFRLRERLDRLLADPPLTKRAERKARTELPKRLRKAHGKVADRMRARAAAAPGANRDAATHRARKAGKRLRHAAELAEPALGKATRRFRKRAKDFTKKLGEVQDSVVARPPLRELGIAAHLSGDNAFTFGLLAGQERATDRDAAIAKAWRRLNTRPVS